MPSSRGSCQPKDLTHVSDVSCIGRQIFYHQHHLGSPSPDYTSDQLNLNLSGQIQVSLFVKIIQIIIICNQGWELNVKSNFYTDTRNVIIIKALCWLSHKLCADKTQAHWPASPNLVPCIISSPNNLHFLSTFYALVVTNSEKAMAPHSSSLAWKIPWMEEPGGL